MQIKFTLNGDLSFGEPFLSENPFSNIQSTLTDSDFNVVNLEGPFLTYARSIQTKRNSCYSNANNLDWLLRNKLNVVCLANNHIMDFSKSGLNGTIALLNKNGIKYFGAGENLQEASKPVIIIINQIKVALLGYCWDVIQGVNATSKTAGTAPLLKNKILADVRALRDECDFMIISLHFNYEFEEWALPLQRDFCHQLIDEGVNVIYGHHPHIIQGIERYNDGVIFYSLGNFYFSDLYDNTGKLLRKWRESSKFSYTAQIVYENTSKQIKINIHPFYCHHNLIIPLSDPELTKFYNKIEDLSGPLHLSQKDYKRYWLKHKIRKLPDWHFQSYNYQITLQYLYKMFEKIRNRNSIYVLRG